jgi:hypothetical protein
MGPGIRSEIMISSQFTDGDIEVYLAAGPAGGWDIQGLRVKGRQVPPTRKGEFETEKEAKEAALSRARAFTEAEGLKLRG